MARICRIAKLLLVPLVSIIVATDSVLLQSPGASYRGKYLGPLTSRKHGVSGHVYAVDSRTLHLQNFNYDGTGPDAFFWVGFTDSPSPQGIIVPNERGTKEVLTGYNNADITISLPDGLTLRDIKWFAVWCRAYEVNFGDIYIPPNFDYPQPHVVGNLLGQGVSSGPIVVVDAQTILVPDFSFDGQAPDLHFWVGRGSPGPDGIRVPDETGTDAGLARADKKTLVLSLPGDLTIFDIDYFGVYSRSYNVDYGHVRITPGLNVPPSLRMLGISPQARLNCEVLHDEYALEIRWSVVGSGETIVFQLVGRIADNNYMAFGLSGESDRSVMLGGDVAVGWLDQSTGRGHVTDYYLERKSSCIGNAGACPDVQWKEGTNNVRMLSAASVNGFTILTYQRKLGAADIYDKPILTNGSQPVIWAVGPIKNGEAQYHFLRNKDDLSIDFGRVPKWNCPQPEGEPETSANAPSPATYLLQQSTQQNTQTTTIRTTTIPSTTTTTTPTTTTARTTMTTTTGKPPKTADSSSFPKNSGGARDGGDENNSIAEYKTPATAPSPTSWQVPPIPCYEPDDRVYYAQLGPTGGTYGYRSITGRQDKPQEAWYINGLLLPEIYLVRNLNYTFVIQGGDNTDVDTDYNPFYITDDPEGGHEAKSLIERQGVKTYAGVEYDSRGRDIATAVGKLCRWVENGNQAADFFTSYAAYQRSLFLNCDKGHSGILHFTPSKDTPDLLYYQSYTKRHLGWKIHVVDDCQLPSESKVEPVQIEQEQKPAKEDKQPGGILVGKLNESNGASFLQQQHQPSQLALLNAQSRNPDQRPGETINHPSNLVTPLLSLGGGEMGGGDSKAILNNQATPVISPISGMGSGRPMENAYLFAAGSNPAGMQAQSIANNMKTSQFVQQQSQHQQMPNIISLDPTRLLINAKPVDANGVPVAHHPGIAQYAQLHGHTVVSMPTQPDAFHFPHHHNNGAYFQVAMDGTAATASTSGTGGVGVSGTPGNRIQTPGAASFSAPTTFQLPGQLTEGHLMRRTGPQQLPQQQLSPTLLAQQQNQQGISLNQFKFTKVVSDRSEMIPEFFIGSNRAPLLSHPSHPVRYDGIPMHSIVYATTGSPISRATGNPISSFLVAQQQHQQQQQQQQHIEKPHFHPNPQFELGGQNPLVRIRSEIGAPNGGVVEGMKFFEMAGSPTAASNIHNIHIMDNSAQGSRIAPVSGSLAPPSAWTQARNLPKREQKHPYFVVPKEAAASHHPTLWSRLNRQGTRAATLKSLNGGITNTARENENLYETEKMDEPTNSHPQSSTQRSGPDEEAPQGTPQQQQPSSSTNAPNIAAQGTIMTTGADDSVHQIKPSRKCKSSSSCKLASADSGDDESSDRTAPFPSQFSEQSLQKENSTAPDTGTSTKPGDALIKTNSVSSENDGQDHQQISRDDNQQQEKLAQTSSTQRKLQVHRRRGDGERDERLLTSSTSSSNSKASPVFPRVGSISGIMNKESENRNMSNNRSSTMKSIPCSTATWSNNNNNNNNGHDNCDDYGSGEKMMKTSTKHKRTNKSAKLMITMVESNDIESRNNNKTTTAMAASTTSPTIVVFSTSAISTTTTPSTTTSSDNNIDKAGHLISQPVFESFIPVFRPSPLDFEGLNVSLNFEGKHTNSESHRRPKQQQYNRLHQFGSLHQGSGRNMAYSAARDSVLSASHPSISSPSVSHASPLPQGLQGHHHHSDNYGNDDFPSASPSVEWEKRKFRKHPQLLVNIGSSGGEMLSTTKGEYVGKALRFPTTGSSLPSSYNIQPFSKPQYASPTGTPHFQDAIQLFNWHRQRLHHHNFPFTMHQQQHQQRYRLPMHLLPPGFPIPSSTQNRINFNGLSSNYPRLAHHHHPVSKITSRKDPVSGQLHQQTQQHYFSSSPSPSVSTPMPINKQVSMSAASNVNQEASDKTALFNVSKTQFHLLVDEPDEESHQHRNKQIDNASSWLSSDLSERAGESIQENGMMTPPELTRSTTSSLSSSISSSSPAVHYHRKSSLTQENLIRMEEEAAASASTLTAVPSSSLISSSSKKRNLIGWNKHTDRNLTAAVTPITTTSTEAYATDMTEERKEAELQKGRDDRPKSSNDGGQEEEGGSPDPLSLTLLTDIWQTINQDNGSKTPSHKPPNATPQLLQESSPSPQKSLLPQVTSSPVSHQILPSSQSQLYHQRYGFQRIPNNRHIPPPPRMLPGGSLRNRTPPHMLFPIRRQHPYHHHPSSTASLYFPPHSQPTRQGAGMRVTA